MSRTFDRPRAEAAIREFLLAIGEDLDDENVRETPQRVTKMYCEELLAGHNDDPKIKSFPTPNVGNTFVVTRKLAVRSLCSHHLMPVTGVCHIGAYYEEGVFNHVTTLPGLSKYQRLVSHYARRLQLQERMNKQIADDVVGLMGASWAIVYTQATHHCMAHRGVENSDSDTITTSISIGGHNTMPLEFYKNLRLEFFQELAVGQGR